MNEIKKHKSIDWMAVINQAILDIRIDGSQNAANALPWISEWLLLEGRQSFGEPFDDE